MNQGYKFQESIPQNAAPQAATVPTVPSLPLVLTIISLSSMIWERLLKVQKKNTPHILARELSQLKYSYFKWYETIRKL